MKTLLFVSIFAVGCLFYSFYGANKKLGDPVYIPASVQRKGDARAGYRYLTEGDYLKSGIPLSFFKMSLSKGADDLGRDGINKGIPYNFNAVNAPNGETIVSPNCLQCHAQAIDGQLIVGLGNSQSDYTSNRSGAAVFMEKILLANQRDSAKFTAAKNFIRSLEAISPYLITANQGVNIADRLAALLVAHRDPKSFIWLDSSRLPFPNEVIPTDVPPWWLLSKKHAMFYNGFGRGDFGRFLMASNLLTVTDTSEAAEVDSHFNDVLAYIYSLKPPPYPGAVNKPLAARGQIVFETSCSGCHGSYGNTADYPNLLIPEDVIQTDSLLYAANYSSPQFVNWFNQSWFTSGDHPAKLVPFKGYIAPPLDGIWATAPYLHNGSVPSLETLLNSKLRPKYWSRNFKNPQYNVDSPGWRYREETGAVSKETYNTTLRGYSNAGHTFGDALTQEERTALLEYLKTL